MQTLSHDLAGTSRDHDLGFTYNPASQVHSRSASNLAYAWTGGSNVARPYTVNGLNQYGAAGTATFGYDANGNLASTPTRLTPPPMSTTSRTGWCPPRDRQARFDEDMIEA